MIAKKEKSVDSCWIGDPIRVLTGSHGGCRIIGPKVAKFLDR